MRNKETKVKIMGCPEASALPSEPVDPDAPPKRTPAEIRQGALKLAQAWRARYKEAIARFKKDFRKHPAHTLEWSTEEIFQVEVMKHYGDRVIGILDKHPDDKLEQILTVEITRFLGQCLTMPPRMRSSSQFANLMEHAEFIAKSQCVRQLAELLERFDLI